MLVHAAKRMKIGRTMLRLWTFILLLVLLPAGAGAGDVPPAEPAAADAPPAPAENLVPDYLRQMVRAAWRRHFFPDAKPAPFRTVADAARLIQGRVAAEDVREAALRLLEGRAEALDPEAMRLLAGLIEQERVVGYTREDAYDFYHAAAAAGDAEATMHVAWMHEQGIAGAVDLAAAEQWYRQAAELGAADALAELAFLLECGQYGAERQAEAMVTHDAAITAGSRQAAIYKGVSLLYGWSGRLDEREAYRLLESAARTGHGGAHAMLAQLIAEDRFPWIARHVAFLHMLVAADLADIDALHVRGMARLRMGQQGEYEKGWRDMLQSGDAGNTFSLLHLAREIEQHEPWRQVDKLLLIEQAAEMGNATASRMLLEHALQGGRPEQLAKATDCYRQTHRTHASLIDLLIADGWTLADAFAKVSVLAQEEAYVELSMRHTEAFQMQGEDMVPPHTLSIVQPVYPDGLRLLEVGGTVTVKFVVFADGTTGRFAIEASPHPDLSAATIEALRQWRFAPGSKDGDPVAIWVRIEFPYIVAR
jgi:TonB family protein